MKSFYSTSAEGLDKKQNKCYVKLFYFDIGFYQLTFVALPANTYKTSS